MRFTFATIALFVGLAVASPVETVYTTKDVTVISCAASVTNCPGRHHQTSTASVAPVSTGSSPVVPPPSISVITLTTCVPTTSLSTITLSPTAPPTGSPTGTGVGPTSTITPPPFTGAANPLAGSFALAAGAAAAAVLFV